MGYTIYLVHKARNLIRNIWRFFYPKFWPRTQAQKDEHKKRPKREQIWQNTEKKREPEFFLVSPSERDSSP